MTMLTTVEEGDAKKLAELMRQDHGFNVNQQDEDGRTLLHYACLDSSRSAIIPLLLADPHIDVNLKNQYGSTPFLYACYGRTSCVREMLKDSRVKVNEPDGDGWTPLWRAACYGHLDVIKWWIASGREMDLGTPGDIYHTDAIGGAKKYDKTEVASLLERFKSDPTETRHVVRLKLGWYNEAAAEMFAMVVFVSDGLLQIKETSLTPATRFFNLTRRLPLELQIVLCCRLVESGKDLIPDKEREVAFKELAGTLI